MSTALNSHPAWRYMLILAVVVFAVLYATPAFYPPDHAIQVRPSENQSAEGALELIAGALNKVSLTYSSEQDNSGQLLLRFRSGDDQLRAQTLIRQVLAGAGRADVVALSLAPTTPEWLARIGGQPMKYGLDLSGGVHFLLEVDVDKLLEDRLSQDAALVKDLLRKEKIRYHSVTSTETEVRAVFRSSIDQEKAEDLLVDELPNHEVKTLPDLQIICTLRAGALSELESYAIAQNLQSLRNRVNELGVSEPLVQRLGRHRIVLDLPGVQDSAKAKEIIGKVANLEFRMENHRGSVGGVQTHRYEGTTVKLEQRIIATGDRVINAKSGYDQETSLPQVNITLDNAGGDLMHRATRNNIGRRMAVIFKEIKASTQFLEDEDGNISEHRQTKEVKRIISLATVQAALGNRFRITGLSQGEATDLALLLRAGALAAPMYIVEERTVGASLGEENVNAGVRAVAVGLILVLLFMLVYYRVFGLAANIALLVNLTLLVACMSILGATLTLPGIAGIVLTVGMAVDANVLIFSRIREELASSAPQKAIHAGFERAFVTILDANLTTFIVAVILYVVGTGPIKGFAVTLAIGILTSMFSAIWVTRAIVNIIYGQRTVERLAI